MPVIMRLAMTHRETLQRAIFTSRPVFALVSQFATTLSASDTNAFTDLDTALTEVRKTSKPGGVGPDD